jgi:hypothetical protein
LANNPLQSLNIFLYTPLNDLEFQRSDVPSFQCFSFSTMQSLVKIFANFVCFRGNFLFLARLSSLRLLLLLPATLSLLALTHAQAPGRTEKKPATPENTNSAARPDLLGHVLSTNGLPHATVFISTAGPKVGTSTFCPSCYADCRKSAKTDAQGDFKIESLDPQLRFQILVVAPGYKPKFVSKVDPAKGPLKVSLEVSRAGEAPPGNGVVALTFPSLLLNRSPVPQDILTVCYPSIIR